MVDQLNNEPKVKVTRGDGTVEYYTVDEAAAKGIKNIDPNGGTDYYSYTNDMGKNAFTRDSSVLPASMTINKSTGNIEITAPKEVTDLPEFQKIFNTDDLKKYSLAYKLNPDYKVIVKDYDEKTGEEKGQKEVTIPEWVEDRNEALKRFMTQLQSINEIRERYRKDYGDKVDNLSLTQIIMSREFDKYTYVPEAIKKVGTFGDNRVTNPISKVLDKIQENGTISTEDLKEFYNRDYFGRTELAGLLATIDGALATEWGDTYYEGEDGEMHYNTASAEEAAKLIAFKNFILSHHPEGNWFQEMGGNIETFSYSALYGATRVLANAANDIEWIATLGQGHNAQNYIKDIDKTMSFYVETKSLESEATSTLYTLGMIGGTIAGTYMLNKLGNLASMPLKAAVASGVNNAAAAVSSASLFSGVQNTATLLNLANYSKEISIGTLFAVQLASTAQKAALATSIYHNFMNKLSIGKWGVGENLNYVVEFLMDTVHDALLYDSTTLRDALEATDGDVRDFWMGQLADNAKWWSGMAGVKLGFKISGKTTLGKAANVVLTRFNNKVAAKLGTAKAKIKDKVHGGSIISDLEDKLKKAIEKDETNKVRRIERKIEIERMNGLLRDSREQLKKLELEWDGLKLKEDSLKQYQNVTTRIRALELGFDRYRNSVEYKRQEMIGPVKDPSTGKVSFINKSLAEANIVASNDYYNLATLAKKYNLTLADRSLISQEMIDYWVSGMYEKRALAFSEHETDAGARAKNALPIIQENMLAAKANLPDEIVNAINDIVDKKVYQAFYLELNEYGMSKGVFNRARVSGYYEDPTWAEIGYVPIVVDTGARGMRIIDPEGLTEAKISKDMEKMNFDVAEGQHYQDPELVRSKHINDVAQMELNRQLFKAYSSYGSDASNITRISGEETEYVRILNENRKAVSKAVSDSSKKVVSEKMKEGIDITKVRRRKPIKNTTVPEADRNIIVNSMDPVTVNSFLVKTKKIGEGETVVSTVTEDNYSEWYSNQTPAVKKYLTRQYQLYDPEGYTTRYYAKDITSGTADADTRTKLAQAVADESNGEKLVAWRTQSTGVDKFYGSAGGTGAPNDVERAKWEGGRWTSIGGEPWSIGGYGDQKLAFPVKKADILDKYTSNEYKDTAHELYVMKYGKKAEKEIYLKSYEQLGQSVEDLPHYAEISGLKKSDLKKVADGDPKALLDVSNKKIIQYDAGDASQQYVMFPDRNPELFKEGVKDMAEMSKLKAAGTYQYFKNAADAGGADFEDGLQRAMLVGDKSFAKDSLMNEARHNLDMGREAFYQGILIAEIKSKLRNVKNVDTTKLVDDMIPEIKGIIDSYVKVVLDDAAVMKSVAVLAESSNASEEFARYVALRQLSDEGMDDATEAITDVIHGKLRELKDISTEDTELIESQMRALFRNTVESELDDVSQSVRTTNPDLVDAESIYNKADALDKRIREIEPEKGADSNVVTYLDDQGRQVFSEVDPAFASLYNFRYRMDKGEASAIAKFNAMTSRWFRYGTTSVNLKAFGNQLFRDFGNALFIGGAWHTIKYYRQNLVDVFGKNIVDQIGRFDPSGYEMKQLQALADDTGQTLEEAAVSRELMRGAANAPSSTERTLYKKFMEDAYADSDGKLSQMKNKISDFVKQHTGKEASDFSPEHLLNDKRENYLRNRVFAASFDDALKQGYDLEQARVFADFAMDNATTNFGRQLYHMQAIADSTPYFRAAINGSKSFWRMWSLDPVGISGRITCGLVIPVMYLVGASLGSEENRKVYENIPEYQKQDSLVFVVRGGIVSLPMPQELATFVAPYRQFVEYLYNSNKNDFWELMMNDALGFLPYDLQGFTTIDMDKMIQDPTIFDRISRGVSRLFSQMAPIPLKTAYMIGTGTDPYTGKNLRNPEYSYWNDETGSVETLDYSQNEFAKWFAQLPFVKGWMSPELAEKVVSGVIGSTGSNLLGDITAIFTMGPGGALEKTLQNATESLAAPFTVPKYDLITAIWKREVKEMTARKNALLQDSRMQTLNKELSKTNDPKKRKELLAERANLVHEYQQQVGDMVKRLETNYQGTFGAAEFAAVLQLLNFNTDTAYQNGSQYMSDLATDVYFEGRDDAIQTMRALGIDGVHDNSIFGYLTKDSKGNIVVRYNSPVAIMEMGADWSDQGQYHLANIKALVSENSLWDRKKDMDAKVKAIYDKSSLSSDDYDKINELYIDWNKEVMKTLAPYIEVMTPEAAVNNTAVMDYLDDLIEIPSEFKKDRNGKYVTSSKLGAGSATDAYIGNYIRYIFGVNDTGYVSGRNYSDRKTYDKENKRWTK